MMETVEAGRLNSIGNIPEIFEQLEVCIKNVQESMHTDMAVDPAPAYTCQQIDCVTHCHALAISRMSKYVKQFEISSISATDDTKLDNQLKEARASLRMLSLLAHNMQQQDETIQLGKLFKVMYNGVRKGFEAPKSKFTELVLEFRDFFNVLRNCGFVEPEICNLLEQLEKSEEQKPEIPATSQNSSTETPMTQEFMTASEYGNTREKLNMLVRASLDVARFIAEEEKKFAAAEEQTNFKKFRIKDFLQGLKSGQRVWIKYILVRLGELQSPDMTKMLMKYAGVQEVAAMQELLESFRDAVSVEKAMRATSVAKLSKDKEDSNDPLADQWDLIGQGAS